jgi:hypothetical protein
MAEIGVVIDRGELVSGCAFGDEQWVRFGITRNWLTELLEQCAIAPAELLCLARTLYD